MGARLDWLDLEIVIPLCLLGLVGAGLRAAGARSVILVAAVDRVAHGRLAGWNRPPGGGRRRVCGRDGERPEDPRHDLARDPRGRCGQLRVPARAAAAVATDRALASAVIG